VEISRRRRGTYQTTKKGRSAPRHPGEMIPLRKRKGPGETPSGGGGGGGRKVGKKGAKHRKEGEKKKTVAKETNCSHQTKRGEGKAGK